MNVSLFNRSMGLSQELKLANGVELWPHRLYDWMIDKP